MKTKEKGFALVLALVLLLVMSLMGGALIIIASSDHGKNTENDRYQQTFYVAETALLEGERYILDKYLGEWDNNTAIRKTTNRFLPLSQNINWDGKMNKVNYSTSTILDGEPTLCFKSFKDLARNNVGVPTNLKIVTAESFNYGVFLTDAFESSGNSVRINEAETLNQYFYEYFIVRLGSAPFRGKGSSVKKKAGNSSSNGIAYRIYGCGIYINKNSTTSRILIPLESTIILPK